MQIGGGNVYLVILHFYTGLVTGTINKEKEFSFAATSHQESGIFGFQFLLLVLGIDWCQT